MSDKRPTLLVINVHFAPNSFGGATVVAENLVEEMSRRHGWRVIVMTTHQNSDVATYRLVRYTIDCADIFSVAIPDEGALNYEERYDNLMVTAIFRRIAERIDVDVAHVHSIQNMGIGVLQVLEERRIPFVTTVHDCWWLCERMFMIDRHGRYCNQRTIDMSVCRGCVISADNARSRMERLATALERSHLLLFPSDFHRDLYVANGFGAQKCIVNKNGVQLPQAVAAGKAHPVATRPSSGIIRFAFVGGPGVIKGAPLIRKAFSELPHRNYELVVIDVAQNRGLTWAKSFDWDLRGELIIAPPYDRDSMDSFFSGVDVLLFPSQWKESFGLVVREALARGVWVIATDAGGVAEDCVDGVNATIIPMDGGYTGLREAIRGILEDGAVPKGEGSAVVSVAEQAEEVDRILRGRLAGGSAIPDAAQHGTAVAAGRTGDRST